MSIHYKEKSDGGPDKKLKNNRNLRPNVYFSRKTFFIYDL